MTKRECKTCGEKFTPVAEYPQSLFCNSVCESMENKINWEEIAKEFKQGIVIERKKSLQRSIITAFIATILLVVSYTLIASVFIWSLRQLGVYVPDNALMPVTIILLVIKSLR